MLEHPGVGVGEVVGDEYFIVVKLECVLEGQGVVVFGNTAIAVCLSGYIALPVQYVLAYKMPAKLIIAMQLG